MTEARTSLGAEKISLHVLASNTRARKLYEKMGFQVGNEQRQNSKPRLSSMFDSVVLKGIDETKKWFVRVMFRFLYNFRMRGG